MLELAKKDNVQEYISASAVTDIYYISRRQLKNRETVRELLRKLLLVVSVAAVSEADIIAALDSEWGDFEDSVQYTVALSQNVDFIIIRNPGDYRESKTQVLLPEEALESIRFCFTSSVIYTCFLPASLYAKIMLWTNDNMIKIEKLCPTT